MVIENIATRADQLNENCGMCEVIALSASHSLRRWGVRGDLKMRQQSSWRDFGERGGEVAVQKDHAKGTSAESGNGLLVVG